MFPNQIPFPSVALEDYLNQSAIFILFILQIIMGVVPSLEYGNRTKNTLIKIAELHVRATKKLSIIIPVVTPTPTLPHISVPVKDRRDTYIPFFPPAPSHKVPFSQPNHLRECISTSLHPNYCQQHRQFRTRLIRKIKI